MKSGIAVMLQARMGSQRLPGKVLKPLGGMPMVAQILTRVRSSKLCNDFFLLTTRSRGDDPLAQIGVELNANVVRGSEEDVLSRFITALDDTDADIIVRLTGDNPFVDGALIDYLLAAYLSAKYRADYANNIEESGFPYGLSAEIIRRDVLLEAHEKGLTADDREHVTYYVRKRPDKYRLQTIHAPGSFPVSSLTIDTIEQYETVSDLFLRMQRIDPDFTFYDLMNNFTEVGAQK